jgi:Tol biopolymer transport system component
MTTEQRLERDLSFHLGDIAMGPYPEYIDDVLSITAHRRQRPRWTFPERWLPVDIATTPVPTTGMPRRRLGVLALLGVLLAALLGAALFASVGTRQQAVPAPLFGPAANGALISASDGDILTTDPVTGKTTPLVSGPERDSAPVWSRDGTRIAFTRDAGLLFVARADGSGLVQITPEFMSGLTEVSFSPDGRSVVALAPKGGEADIIVASSDGTQPVRAFSAGATLGDGPPQYHPDGTEILFIGRNPGAEVRSVLALDPASSNVRILVAPAPDFDIWGAAWSPDGTKIAYGTHNATAGGLTTRTHVVNADGTGDVAVDTHPDSFADGPVAWSNDGTRLIITRFYGGEDVTRSVVVPVDRSGTGVEIACAPGVVNDACATDWSWSPDDTVLRGPHLLADPLTGDIRTPPWTATDVHDWQRLAR